MSFPWYVSLHQPVVCVHEVFSFQLELSPDSGPSILERMTFTYALGDQHGLYEAMRAAQSELGE